MWRHLAGLTLSISALLLVPAVGWCQTGQTPVAANTLDGARPIWSPTRPARDSGSSDTNSSTLRLVQQGWGQTRPAEPADSGSTVLRWRTPEPDGTRQAAAPIPLEPANWQSGAGEPSYPVRTVSHEEPSDSFRDPFGDKLAQSRKSAYAAPQPQGAAEAAESGQPGALPSLDDLLPQLESQSKPAAEATEAPGLPAPENLLPPGQPQQPAPAFEIQPPSAAPQLPLPEPAAPRAPAGTPPAEQTAPWLPGPTRPTPGQTQPAPAAPGQADEPRLPLRTPAPYMPPSDPVPYRQRAAADCQRIYNDRDCCQEDENCKAARLALKQNSIRNISLDITASFRPDAATLAEAEQAEQDQLRLMPARVWRDRSGQLLAEGRVIDLHHRRIEVEQADGSVETIRLGQLGDDELCFLAAYWRVPSECTLGDEVYVERAWQPQTFTWTASALAHKPLYFEERQLERYGHTTGPFLQPVLSGAHFFLNVAVLPYKMGINPPNECQYPLGYYRPGSCAPWLLPPAPLSVRGGLLQAGAVTGLVFLFP